MWIRRINEQNSMKHSILMMNRKTFNLKIYNERRDVHGFQYYKSDFQPYFEFSAMIRTLKTNFRFWLPAHLMEFSRGYKRKQMLKGAHVVSILLNAFRKLFAKYLGLLTFHEMSKYWEQLVVLYLQILSEFWLRRYCVLLKLILHETAF